MKYALTNHVLYTGHAVLYGQAVVVEQDKIIQIVDEATLDAEIVKKDLQGANLCAGFIDLQLNGCGGVMFNEETTLETLEIMQKTNLKSGTTSFLPTFITAPDEGMQQAVLVMETYLSTHKNEALGLHLEGPYLSVEKKGVHREEYVRSITPEMKDFLCQHANAIKMLTLAVENPTAEFIPEFVKNGIVVSVGHSNGTFAQTQQAIERGASCATHLHNAMSPIHSGREMGVVGAVLYHDIYAGIIVDGLHIDFANVALDKKLKGEKLYMVTDATAAAGANIQEFNFVGKKVYVREGKCYDENGTLGGSAVTLIESLENAVKKVGISLFEAIRMCTLYPARAIGVADKLGSVECGKIANLTAFDHQFKVIGTAVNGLWQDNISH